MTRIGKGIGIIVLIVLAVPFALAESFFRMAEQKR
jgi:hypothetical protein